MEKEEFEELIGIGVSNEMFFGIIEPMYQAVPALREKGFCELLNTDGIRKLDNIMKAIERAWESDYEESDSKSANVSCEAENIFDDYFNSDELDQLFYDTPLDLDEAVKELGKRNNLPF